jgi:hypothetical protein
MTGRRPTKRTIGRTRAEELASMIDATRAELCKIKCTHDNATTCHVCNAYILLVKLHNEFKSSCF